MPNRCVLPALIKILSTRHELVRSVATRRTGIFQRPTSCVELHHGASHVAIYPARSWEPEDSKSCFRRV